MTSPATPSTGLAPNVAGALAYVLGPITGVLFLVLEKDNRFVRFHAAQSITVGLVLIAISIALSILSTVLAFVPVVGWIVGLLLALVLGFGGFILWLLLMWRASQGKEWEVPVAGSLARRLVP
jgi:uncharacterized membrane protein